MANLEFNQPYERPDSPQAIRQDFENLADLSNQGDLLHALALYIPSDTLAEFIDDRLMGRV